MDQPAVNKEKLKAFSQRLNRFFEPGIAERTFNALAGTPAVSVRVNSRKNTDQFDGNKKIPWTQNGYLLDQRPVFALDPLFHAGAYYVQDASSMILEAVLSCLHFEHETPLLLDACAAPGGKSLILMDVFGDKAFLVANEVDQKRNSILQENLLKWGNANCAVARADSSVFARLPETFDLVLVDAPCSGEGMFRKDSFALEQWSENLVEHCAALQGHLLKDFKPCLKAGGYMVYATCTLNPFENQLQVEKLLHEGFELALPSLAEYTDYIVPAEQDGKVLGYYMLPGISLGEGLFVSVLKKTGTDQNPGRRSSYSLPVFQQKHLENFGIGFGYDFSWTNGREVFGVNDPYGLHRALPSNFSLKTMGLPAFEPKGKIIVPLHGLAMDTRMKNTGCELDLNSALNYLRKQSISAPGNTTPGWSIAAYRQHPLGWMKIVPGRANNHYPSNLRLRM